MHAAEAAALDHGVHDVARRHAAGFGALVDDVHRAASRADAAAAATPTPEAAAAARAAREAAFRVAYVRQQLDGLAIGLPPLRFQRAAPPPLHPARLLLWTALGVAATNLLLGSTPVVAGDGVTT